MKILIFENYQQLVKKAAEFLAVKIKKNPKMVLGLATGGTMIGFYQELVLLFQKKMVNFAQVKTFNLDEYFGLGISDKQSFAFFMQKNLFSKVNLKKQNVNFLDGKTDKPVKECLFFENKIKASGGLGLQVLGLGANGHLAFNEPGSAFNSGCRLVKLTLKTRKDNSRFFSESKEVPQKALTLGLGNIIKAKEIILLASGKQKAKAVKVLVWGKISPKWPCSILRQHSQVTLFLDRAAASLL